MPGYPEATVTIGKPVTGTPRIHIKPFWFSAQSDVRGGSVWSGVIYSPCFSGIFCHTELYFGIVLTLNQCILVVCKRVRRTISSFFRL